MHHWNDRKWFWIGVGQRCGYGIGAREGLVGGVGEVVGVGAVGIVVDRRCCGGIVVDDVLAVAVVVDIVVWGFVVN